MIETYTSFLFLSAYFIITVVQLFRIKVKINHVEKSIAETKDLVKRCEHKHVVQIHALEATHPELILSHEE
jgi:hypothetical protein